MSGIFQTTRQIDSLHVAPPFGIPLRLNTAISPIKKKGRGIPRPFRCKKSRGQLVWPARGFSFVSISEAMPADHEKAKKPAGEIMQQYLHFSFSSLLPLS
ncbi:MAG: hypothetical protein PHG91_05050 [Syntrophales bacterium]|nr:hypothetical protein [Syntrophales bacterium]MDD5531990.1 hypothetical protein [Syntrophales bacterium]